jgi:hypothetical protein
MVAQMFVVIATRGAERIQAAIEALPLDTYYELKSDTWFVLYEGTTKRLAESLGIRTGTNGSGVVAPISGYSGRASSDFWDWIKVKWPTDG